MLDTLGTGTWQNTFHVVRETTRSVLLGRDFLAKTRALLDVTQAKLQLWDVSIPLLTSADFVPSYCDVSVAKNMILPPLNESAVPVNIGPTCTFQVPGDFMGYIEPNVSESAGLVVAHTLTHVHNGHTEARTLNPTGHFY